MFNFGEVGVGEFFEDVSGFDGELDRSGAVSAQYFKNSI